MKRLRFLVLCLVITTGLVFTSCEIKQEEKTFLNSADSYLGQKKAGTSPELFAKDIVSKGSRTEGGVQFSADGKTCLVFIAKFPQGEVLLSEFKDNKWSELKKSSFSESRVVIEPIFSPDGKRIYFSSPDTSGQFDIYFVEYDGTLWGDVKNVGAPVNTIANEYHPSVLSDGSIYFCDEIGKVAVCRLANGVYQEREILPEPINMTDAKGIYGDAWVAPDESFMLLKSVRSDSVGGYDNYISHHNEDGTWGQPKNFGKNINTKFDEFAADLSPDGKYVFFGSKDNMYWVKSDFLKSLK